MAIYKSQTLVLEILNPQAAQDTKESMMLAVAAGMKAAKVGKEAVEAGASLALGAVSGGAGTAAMMGAKAGATAGKAAAKTAGQAMKKGAKKAVKSAAQKTKQAVGDTAGKITQGSENDS